MSTADWTRVKQVLGAALQREPSQRAGLVADLCRGDDAVRARVEVLLAVEGAAEAAFSSMPGAAIAQTGDESHDPADPVLPKRVGRYAVRRLIAVGGMGQVYEGEQDNPRRRVALKVAGGVMTRSGIARFRQEGEILGRLQHPGIAQIYEAGVEEADSGQRPFFAMELVEGRPLTLYADQAALGVKQRAALMVEVCDAVHHAHLNGVIHRDLKPDNILVDVAGRIKVVDFGVARLADAQSPTLRTQAGEMMGTIPYMSPEQLAGDPRDVDARSDVYTLGVVLYELLGGRRPHERADRSLPGSVRAACEDEAPPLGSINPLCRGDLELMAGRALERDPARRYQSAAEVGADLRRFLADEPVMARPPSVWYQVRKLARRKRPLAVGVMAGMVCLALGLAAAAWEAMRALDEAARAREINAFLVNMIGSTNPYDVGKRLNPVEILDAAASDIPVRFANRPIAQAELHDAFGRAYFSQGASGKAEAQLRLAWDLRRAQLGPDDPATLDSGDMLGQVLIMRGSIQEARAILQATVADRERVLGPGHPDTLWSVCHLSPLVSYSDDEDARAERERLARWAADGLTALLGPGDPRAIQASLELSNAIWDRPEAAIPLRLKTVDESTRAHGKDHPYTLMARSQLVSALRTEEAAALAEEIVEVYQSEMGLESQPALRAVNVLARAWIRQGRLRDAEDQLRFVVETCRRVVGDRSPMRLGVQLQLGALQQLRGAYDEAEQSFRDSWERYRHPLSAGPEWGMTIDAQCRLAGVLAEMGPEDSREAEALALSAYKVSLRKWGPENAKTLRAAAAVAAALRGQGQAARGEAIVAAALEAAGEAGTDPQDMTALARGVLGGCLADQGRWDEAECELQEAYEAQALKRVGWNPGVRAVVRDLASLYEHRHDGANAAVWRARLAAFDHPQYMPPLRGRRPPLSDPNGFFD